MTKTELEYSCRQREIVKLVDTFIFSDNNNDHHHVPHSISQNGKWISGDLSKELEIETEENEIRCYLKDSRKYITQNKRISNETNFPDSYFSLAG